MDLSLLFVTLKNDDGPPTMLYGSKHQQKSLSKSDFNSIFFFSLLFSPNQDILPTNEESQAETREFLQKIIDILLDYVNASNDRNEKILEFHHPEDMVKLLDLDIGQAPVSLQQLVHDCAITMKYGVKTGEN